jgi:hypothetical protein
VTGKGQNGKAGPGKNNGVTGKGEGHVPGRGNGGKGDG